MIDLIKKIRIILAVICIKNNKAKVLKEIENGTLKKIENIKQFIINIKFSDSLKLFLQLFLELVQSSTYVIILKISVNNLKISVNNFKNSVNNFKSFSK